MSQNLIPFSMSSIINRREDVDELKKYLDDRCLILDEDFPGLIISREQRVLKERRYSVKRVARRPYFFLRYLDPAGQPYMKDGEPYELARCLGEPVGWDGKEPPPKVIAPSGRRSELHFEPLRPLWAAVPRAWADLPEGTTVLHLESMVKAKAVHRWLPDYPCIGLNGVNGYSADKGETFIYEDVEGVDLRKLKHVILFDSNVDKRQVAEARDTLAFKLRLMGCKDVRLAELPKNPDGPDWGPDDFLRHHATQDDCNPAEMLEQIIEAANEFAGSQDDLLIARIQQRAVYCDGPNVFVDLEDLRVRDASAAAELYRPVNRPIRVGKVTRTIYGFNLWRDTLERRTVVAPCYAYLGERFVRKPDGEYINLFRPSGVEPAPERTGAADRVIAQIENMLGPKAELARSYLRFLRFEAGKPITMLVLHGTRRGVGKGWFTRMAMRLIGEANAAAPIGRDITGNFNALLQAKRLLVFNEFTTQGVPEAVALRNIKALADPLIRIEPKGKDPYNLENMAGAVFTTNYISDVPVDGEGDRRMEFMEARNAHEPSEAEWSWLQNDALDSEDVMADFARWIEDGERIDFATWKPDANDEERQRVIRDSGSGGLTGELRQARRDLAEHPAGLVCIRAATVRKWLQEGLDETSKLRVPSVQLLSKRMPRADWVSSRKEYGRAADRRYVWVLNPIRFAAIEDNDELVAAEWKRAEIALSKF